MCPPITPQLQHSSFPACWPLHKPFWGGKIHFSRSLEEQHCTHFTKFCLRSVRQSILCAPLSVASILWKLKINSTFWFPFYQPLCCTHAEASRPVTFIHHLCISSLTVLRLLPGITRLIFFNLLKKPTSLQRSYRPGLIWNLPRVIVQLFPQMYNSKSFGKSRREWEREHDKRKWRRKEKTPENDEKCSCHCRYLQFSSCMQHLQTLKVEPHY